MFSYRLGANRLSGGGRSEAGEPKMPEARLQAMVQEMRSFLSLHKAAVEGSAERAAEQHCVEEGQFAGRRKLPANWPV